jgi:hypothetical protein
MAGKAVKGHTDFCSVTFVVLSHLVPRRESELSVESVVIELEYFVVLVKIGIDEVVTAGPFIETGEMRVDSPLFANALFGASEYSGDLRIIVWLVQDLGFVRRIRFNRKDLT